MQRFDKNLNVTNKIFPFSHSLRNSLVCVAGILKGRKGDLGYVRSVKGARGKRKENTLPSLYLPILARFLALKLPFPPPPPLLVPIISSL